MLYKNLFLVKFCLLVLLSSCSNGKTIKKGEPFNNDKASTRTAEQLVASKNTSEMTYKQLMTILGSGSQMMHQGILTENKQMVIEGSELILNHAAPKEKPWLIMIEKDQKNFKNSLLTYDLVLDNHAKKIAEEAKNEDWLKASKSSHELMNSCVICHSMWKNKVK